jgi:hypothetical protein
MTMEDLQHKIRPNVHATSVLEREQQTARPEAHLDAANPITAETIQVQPPELQVDEEEQQVVEAPTSKASQVLRDVLLSSKQQLLKSKVQILRHCSPELKPLKASIQIPPTPLSF